MIRAVKLSLGSLTATKQRRLDAVVRELRAAACFYARSVWINPGKLDAKTQARYTGGSLGYRQKHDMLRLALSTVVATRKAAKAHGRPASVPEFKGALKVSVNLCKVESFRGSFDFCAKFSGLVKGSPIVIPLKSHARLNYWLDKTNAKLLDGCVIGPNWIVVYVKVPDEEPKPTGDDIGVDTGYNKLLATSEGDFHGTGMKAACERVRRCKPGSKGMRRAQRARHNYVNKSVKSLPWDRMRMVSVEDLTGLKLRTQRKDKSSKASRKRMAPWTYRQVLSRIEQLAPEHRVRLVYVDPRDTSRRCPSCGWVAKENRVAENFQCVRCNYRADADTVGAVNVLAKATGNWRELRVSAPVGDQ